MRKKQGTAVLVIGLLAAGALGAAPAQESPPATGCASYKVDVSAEVALLAGPRADVAAGGASDAKIPALETAKPYTLHLVPQADARFVVPPARRMLDEGAFAGIARFKVGAAGTWRISLEHNSWVDVVAPDASFALSSRFGGRADCTALRKLVEFPLKPDIEYTLQLSGGTEPTSTVLITGPIKATP